MSKMEDSCGDISINAINIEKAKGFSYIEKDDNLKHPTPEQLMIRQAEKYLTPKQKEVWELWNYDRLTQDEIALRLGIAQQGVSKHLKAIEKKIAKWVKNNIEAYNLLKEDYSKENE